MSDDVDILFERLPRNRLTWLAGIIALAGLALIPFGLLLWFAAIIATAIFG